ncbi:hypothetical protein SLEP1_g12254 [Rubroshorea leprosula]|uniref:DUF1664 domain-containing protein n=1 Tax=Rubroshorea leprosula TaxID=152421 RepID=A0AAV5IL51_9ROSI|nr:hypothetical protein SLEP1_g12254 [Rubroshorea leprosula]
MALAPHLSQGIAKYLYIFGAGYVTTVLIHNGKLSDLLGELQSLVKRIEKSGDESDDYSDAIAAQMHRLGMEVRQLASAGQITLLNGGSGGNLIPLLVPAAAIGVLGYGYMWWKGMSYKDLLWITKHNVTTAVENLSKHLESVSDALSKAKKHLTKRIQKLDDRMETQTEISRNVQANVEATSNTLSDSKYHLGELQYLIFGLDGKVDSVETKQDFTSICVHYLVQKFGAEKIQIPSNLQEQLKLSTNSHNLLQHSRTPSSKGLKFIVDSSTESINDSGVDAFMQNGISSLDNKQRSLQRAVPNKALIKAVAL